MAEKNNSNSKLLEKMRRFNDNFSKLPSELAVTKQVNTELTKQIVTLERKCWANAQYFKKICLEIVGISRQVDGNQLETKVLSISKRVGCTTDPGFVDGFSSVGKNIDRVTIKFSCGKDCKQVLQVQKGLENLNADDLDLPRGPKFL